MRPTALAIEEIQAAVHGLEATTVSTAVSYDDPEWLTALAGSKIIGDVGGNAASITGSIVEAQVTGLAASLAAKADESAVVHKAGDESIAGTKTFSGNVFAPYLQSSGGVVGNIITCIGANSAFLVTRRDTEVGAFQILSVSGEFSLYNMATTSIAFSVGADGVIHGDGSGLTGVAHLGGVETFTGKKTFTSGFTIDVSGSTQAVPSDVGFVGTGTTWASRFFFGDAGTYLQSGFGTKLQIGAYWGVEISGNRESSGPSFVEGSPSDPALSVIGTTSTAPVLSISGVEGQSGNYFQVLDSLGAPVLTLSSNGILSGNGSALTNLKASSFMSVGASSTSTLRDLGFIDGGFVDPTDDSYSGYISIRVQDHAAGSGGREGIRVQSDGGAARVSLSSPSSQPPDASLAPGQVTFWVDESTNSLNFRIRYSEGTTLKSGSVPLS